ncbi:MAG: hypothetical protein QNJ42_02370 [Crocosphaera sp.]|nr:hypothetical protein [Crocosphaera sp.]
MIDQLTQSNLNIFNHSTMDDSEGGEPLSNIEHSSDQSDIIGIDPKSDLVTVTETLQGLLKESGVNSVDIDDHLMTGEGSNDDPIISFNQEKRLKFTDKEKGVLDHSDQVYGEGYSDEYRLTGLKKNERVILDLKALDFGSSLQLVNDGTGEILYQSNNEDNFHNQLTFTPDKNIDYVVRVTSVEDQGTGGYVLATTLGELTEKLVFSDTETGVLDSSDQTFQGRYRDEYILRGVEDQQTVVLNLDSVGFGSSLQLINRETGQMIDQYEVTETEGTLQTQLTFTSDKDIDYLVRVTSTGESTTGSYTLGTTLGELTLGISDQTIQGTLSEDDQTTDLWRARYTDRYELTNISPFQTIDVNLNASDYNTMVFLIDADTGSYLSSNRGSYNGQEGGYVSQMSYKARAGFNYALVVTSYMSQRTGDYTLTVDTNLSVSGGFDVRDDDVHPILKNRLMDNYLLSDLQVGEDVQLNLNSSSDNLVQLFDQDTGDILQTTNQSNLKFTVEDGINYGVRIVGEAGGTYDLTTDTGLLFDSNVIGLNQTITNSLVTSDFRDYTREHWSYHRYYSDGYYLSADSLQGQDQLEITIDGEFSPELHILNAQTGEILDSYSKRYASKITYEFDVEDGMDYLLLVSSRHNAQTGQYTFNIQS